MQPVDTKHLCNRSVVWSTRILTYLPYFLFTLLSANVRLYVHGFYGADVGL